MTFSAGLFSHAQRALAVATTDSAHDVEKQLQHVSLQVNKRIMHVLAACLPFLQWTVCSSLPIVYLPLLQHLSEQRLSLVAAYLPLPQHASDP